MHTAEKRKTLNTRHRIKALQPRKSRREFPEGQFFKKTRIHLVQAKAERWGSQRQFPKERSGEGGVDFNIFEFVLKVL